MIRPATIAPYMRKHQESVRVIVRRAEWQAIDRIRRDLATPIEDEMLRIFEEQRREIVTALDTFRSQRAAFLSLDAIFDWSRWIGETVARLSNWFRATIFGGYETGRAQAGAFDIELPDLTSRDPIVRDMLDVMNSRSRIITETTREQLKDLIDSALREGWSIDKTADEVQMLFEVMAPHRAKSIAVTNTTAGFSRGQLEAFGRAGLNKSWLSQRDGRVRETHFAADGQRRQVNEPFEVGRALLQYPADPEGGEGHLEEIIQCRCALLPVI